MLFLLLTLNCELLTNLTKHKMLKKKTYKRVLEKYRNICRSIKITNKIIQCIVLCILYTCMPLQKKNLCKKIKTWLCPNKNFNIRTWKNLSNTYAYCYVIVKHEPSVTQNKIKHWKQWKCEFIVECRRLIGPK